MEPSFTQKQHGMAIDDFQRMLNKRYEGVTFNTFQDYKEAQKAVAKHGGYISEINKYVGRREETGEWDVKDNRPIYKKWNEVVFSGEYLVTYKQPIRKQ